MEGVRDARVCLGQIVTTHVSHQRLDGAKLAIDAEADGHVRAARFLPGKAGGQVYCDGRYFTTRPPYENLLPVSI